MKHLIIHCELLFRLFVLKVFYSVVSSDILLPLERQYIQSMVSRATWLWLDPGYNTN